MAALDDSVARIAVHYLSDVLDRGRWSDAEGGKYVRSLEEMFCALTGCPGAVACANGTVAIRMALIALGVGPGDKVIVPANGFLSDVEEILLLGAEPVFVDVDPVTLRTTADLVRGASGDGVVGVLFVHIVAYDHAEVRGIAALCAERGWWLIEDCAHVVGVPHAGEFGDLVTGSLFASKVLSSGEGGLVWGRSAKLLDVVRRIRNHGRERDFASPDIVGTNGRMSEFQAAVGLAVFKHAAELIARRREIVDRYLDVGLDGWSGGNLYKFIVRCPGKADHENALRYIDASVGGRVYAVPLPYEPLFSDFRDGEYPGAVAGCCGHIALRTDVTADAAVYTAQMCKQILGG